ncbi:murein biosynthesis integral membrane protein MurJ [Olsenella urininfantis]|uniref:murein biosynthesis integral membrane protein MurJ n=1 Tax=Olsenella urininfantis TaxID=1871033 RepID=UPI000984BEC6|nr:murein biosynthesis integral membrane protein MurJ [Olsenella urininfantis]
MSQAIGNRYGRHFAAETRADAAPVAVKAQDQQSVSRSAALMSVLVIISRITGFFRTWGQAYALGVTALASAYTVANGMPNQLYELVMGGMIMTAFLPVYMSVKKRLGQDGATRYASNLLSIVTLFMGVLTVASFVLAGPIIWTQSFSATAEFDAGLSVYLFRFFVIEIVLYALSSIVSGVLNAERDYLWSNAAPIFNNVICTLSFVFYAVFAQSNPALAMLLLAVGNPLGVAVQVVMQLPSLRRHGIVLRPHIDWRDPALRETLAIGVPTLVATIASFPTVAVQTSSSLQVSAAGASIAYYARLWYVLPYSVFAIPTTVAMFTELSDFAAADDMASFKEGVRYGSERIIFMLVPFTLYLVFFAPCLITIMAAGKFDSQGLADTTIYLQWLSVSLPFYGISTYLQKICSALRRMKFFAFAIVVASVMQVVFCLTLTDALGLAGVAFSTTLFYLAVDVVTFLHVRSQVGALGLRSMLLSTLRSTFLGMAGVMAGAGIFAVLNQLVGPWGVSVKLSLLYCVCAGVPAVLVTYGLAALLRLPESEAMRAMLARVLRRR